MLFYSNFKFQDHETFLCILKENLSIVIFLINPLPTSLNLLPNKKNPNQLKTQLTKTSYLNDPIQVSLFLFNESVKYDKCSAIKIER